MRIINCTSESLNNLAFNASVLSLLMVFPFKKLAAKKERDLLCHKLPTLSKLRSLLDGFCASQSAYALNSVSGKCRLAEAARQASRMDMNLGSSSTRNPFRPLRSTVYTDEDVFLARPVSPLPLGRQRKTGLRAAATSSR